MIPNSKIFCNSPWYELNIYWDGSFGFCCQASQKLYPEEQSGRYNIKNMTIGQWFDSEPMRQARLMMWGDQRNTMCSQCYQEEDTGSISRRHNSNQKSVIFTRSAFDDSFQQSPGLPKFLHSVNNQGTYDGQPIDLHIDLGNHCNLTCKMCSPRASSSIAMQYRRWNIADVDRYIGTDWTRDQEVWDRFCQEILTIPKLTNIHFMGGETLIGARFEDLVDRFLEQDRTDVGFSFVTNGTVFNQPLMDKLKRFARVGIEISIETMTPHNSYQRQGTDPAILAENLNRYMANCDGSKVTLTVRPAISALTIGYYHTLLQECLDRGLLVKNLLVNSPRYYDARILPANVRQAYRQSYVDFIRRNELDKEHTADDFNYSNLSQIRKVIKVQADQCIWLLDSARPHDADDLLAQMVKWCRRWDDQHGYDARALYPEFRKILDDHGY